MTPILHLHIPRTGGSGIYRHLHPILVKGRRHQWQDNERFQMALGRGGKTAIVSGHFMWGLHAHFPKVVYFIVLRDPIDRIGSIYDFIRATPTHKYHSIYKEMSLLDVLETDGVCASQMANGQVRMICGDYARHRPMFSRHADDAWAHLCRPDVIVAFTDHINDGLAKLAERTGWAIPPLTERVNSTPRSSIDGRTRELAGQLNAWDAKIYNRARERSA